MAFDGIVVKKITEELQNIIGYKIDKIYEPDKNTIILGLYGNFTNLALLSCISSTNYRLHLTTHEIKSPKIALNFCMLLRKHIIGYRITNIYMNDLERIIFIELENTENPDKPIIKKLIIELMGKHSNIILTTNNGIIIDSIRHTSTEENSNRDIYPTSKYILPEQSKYNLLENSPNSKFLNLNNLTIEISEYKLNTPKDFKLKQIDTENSPNIFSLNYALDDFYYLKESNEIFTSYRNNILSLILATLKKYEKRLINIDEKLSECSEKEKYKLYGELITANLYRINESNISSINLENYYDNNKLIEIPLDKKLSPNNNAKKYFKKYNKLKNASEIVQTQKIETINEIKYIESIVYEIENSKTIEDIQYIYDEINDNDIFKLKNSNKYKYLYNKKEKKNKNPKNMTTNKYAKFNPLKYNIDGYLIYVGRNNKENDYLTNKFARKNDIWFHTKDIHGSHVILKKNPGELIPENILFEAAKLAATHSKAKDSSNIPVDYCEVKYVKKIPGNKPGLVIYSNNKTIYV